MARLSAISLTSCLLVVSGGVHFASGSCVGECPAADSGDSLLAHGVQINQDRAAVVEDLSVLHEGKGAMRAQKMEDMLQSLATRSAAGKEEIPETTLIILGSVDAEMDKIIANATSIAKVSQRAVHLANHAITECNADAAEISSLTGTVEAKRTTHSSCREEQGQFQADKNSKCTVLESYRTNLQAPSCLTCGSAGVTGFEDATMGCMKEIGSWYAETNSAWRAKKGLCDAATSKHTATQASCDGIQMAFESSFCMYADALTLVCNAQTDCRKTKTDERTAIYADTRVAEESNKAEMVSATKVKCFINVLRGEPGKQTSLLANCVALNPDTSSLDVTYPKMSSATACDLSVVATKPCDNQWVTTEYQNHRWNSAAPAKSCTACPASPPADLPPGSNDFPPGADVVS